MVARLACLDKDRCLGGTTMPASRIPAITICAASLRVGSQGFDLYGPTRCVLGPRRAPCFLTRRWSRIRSVQHMIHPSRSKLAARSTLTQHHHHHRQPPETATSHLRALPHSGHLVGRQQRGRAAVYPVKIMLPPMLGSLSVSVAGRPTSQCYKLEGPRLSESGHHTTHSDTHPRTGQRSPGHARASERNPAKEWLAQSVAKPRLWAGPYLYPVNHLAGRTNAWHAALVRGRGVLAVLCKATIGG